MGVGEVATLLSRDLGVCGWRASLQGSPNRVLVCQTESLPRVKESHCILLKGKAIAIRRRQ